MTFFALFNSSTKEYRKDLARRVESVNNSLDDATRKLLHAAGRAMIEAGQQDIFTEYHEGLERRRNARNVSN